jgi:hypothetical protein
LELHALKFSNFRTFNLLACSSLLGYNLNSNVCAIMIASQNHVIQILHDICTIHSNLAWYLHYLFGQSILTYYAEKLCSYFLLEDGNYSHIMILALSVCHSFVTLRLFQSYLSWFYKTFLTLHVFKISLTHSKQLLICILNIKIILMDVLKHSVLENT